MDGSSLGHYSEDMVGESYVPYEATLWYQLDSRASPSKYSPLEYVRVSDKRVDISLQVIHKFLYAADVDATRTRLTTKFDYWWKLIKNGRFQHMTEEKETTMWWIAQYLSVDGEAADWVQE